MTDDNNPRLGRCTRCGRIFAIPEGADYALCDRLLCSKALIEPLSQEESAALPADLRPDPALSAKRTYLFTLFEEIDSNRQVSIGCTAEGYLVTFENQGRGTEVVLSGEAIEALCRLYRLCVEQKSQSSSFPHPASRDAAGTEAE